MHRGTTPTNTISVDLDLRGMTVFVTYAQGSSGEYEILFEKTNSDITINETNIVVTLTQSDTLALSARKKTVYVQIRAIDSTGVAIASNIMTTTAEAILKDGEIAYDS